MNDELRVRVRPALGASPPKWAGQRLRGHWLDEATDLRMPNLYTPEYVSAYTAWADRIRELERAEARKYRLAASIEAVDRLHRTLRTR